MITFLVFISISTQSSNSIFLHFFKYEFHFLVPVNFPSQSPLFVMCFSIYVLLVEGKNLPLVVRH